MMSTIDRVHVATRYAAQNFWGETLVALADSDRSIFRILVNGDAHYVRINLDGETSVYCHASHVDCHAPRADIDES